MPRMYYHLHYVLNTTASVNGKCDILAATCRAWFKEFFVLHNRGFLERSRGKALLRVWRQSLPEAEVMLENPH